MALRFESLQGSNPFGVAPDGSAALQARAGRACHVPFAPDAPGLEATAAEMARLDFPRAATADLLAAFQEQIGAPPPARLQAARLAEPDSLVVVAGQQPGVAGGPLLVLYKALSALALARQAEALLGRPVIALFWNASEDHDLAEMARATAPKEPLRFELDLSPWDAAPAEQIGPDPRWQAPARAWLEELSAGPYAPRPSEGFAAWTTRILSEELGPEGLVLVEPRLLRHLAVPLFQRALTGFEQIARLLEASWRERGGERRAFPAQKGPLLFSLEDGRRRRILVEGDGFRPRGGQALPAPKLLERIAAEPKRFSAHGALRPILQNCLFPVLAQVLGPGELAYHEELLLLHASPLGAGRRMPLLWPRLSATVLDRRAQAAKERLGLSGSDLFLPLERLQTLGAPTETRASLADRVAAVGQAAAQSLSQLGPEVLALDPTLATPLEKTLASLARPADLLAQKVAAAEGRALGRALPALERLHAWVLPGGEPQERVFAFAPFLAWWGPGSCRTLLAGLDPFDFSHRLLFADGEE